MKIYQERILILALLVCFAKPLFSHPSSWSTTITRHGSSTVVVPKTAHHTVIQRTNNTSGNTSGFKQKKPERLTHTTEWANSWPFLRNFTLSTNQNHRTKELMSASDKNRWRENIEKSPTFFYTHVEPHRFEYRAMFQHNHNGFKPENFHPFVDEFPPFPKVNFPPFPAFPPFPELFQHKDKPEQISPFRFPPVPPSIRRILEPTAVDKTVQIPPPPIPHEITDGPFKKYDVILGNLDTKYPKIFKFNEERINIVDFEKQKKLKLKLGGLSPNSISGPEYVPREQFLILHGGIFTVQEPPLYSQQNTRKRKLARQRNFYKHSNE